MQCAWIQPATCVDKVTLFLDSAHGGVQQQYLNVCSHTSVFASLNPLARTTLGLQFALHYTLVTDRLVTINYMCICRGWHNTLQYSPTWFLKWNTSTHIFISPIFLKWYWAQYLLHPAATTTKLDSWLITCDECTVNICYLASSHCGRLLTLFAA